MFGVGLVQVNVKLFKGGLKIRIQKLVKCLVMAVAMMIIIELESDFTMVDDSNNDNGTTMTNLLGEENQIIFIAANTKYVFLRQC